MPHQVHSSMAYPPTADQSFLARVCPDATAAPLQDWRGPVPFRASQQLDWHGSLLSGWGPFEVIDMCMALNIEPIITLSASENNATDWADLVE